MGYCICTVCGKKFGGIDGFDRHRIGRYATAKIGQNNRRCLNIAELEKRGFKFEARHQVWVKIVDPHKFIWPQRSARSKT